MTLGIKNYHNFHDAIGRIRDELKHNSNLIDANRWQSIDVPEHVKFYELEHVSFLVHLPEPDDLDYYVEDIQPNIPWADIAFQERVHGIPWNPGTAWEQWPYATSAQNFKQERFSHSYAERYWPKQANLLLDAEWKAGDTDLSVFGPHQGIRFDYGDLDDIVRLMNNDPLTRQAFLPIFFPEDTGVTHGTRVPCTLGYHFFHRYGEMDITYYIRSCDFVRHFRDDLYMSLRLLMWMCDRVDFDVKPGRFIFHCTSMHMFEHDMRSI